VVSEWVPVGLVEEIRLLMPRDQVVCVIGEAEALGRRIRLRKHRRCEARDVRVS
jgi:hypothetical protein